MAAKTVYDGIGQPERNWQFHGIIALNTINEE